SWAGKRWKEKPPPRKPAGLAASGFPSSLKKSSAAWLSSPPGKSPTPPATSSSAKLNLIKKKAIARLASPCDCFLFIYGGGSPRSPEGVSKPGFARIRKGRWKGAKPPPNNYRICVWSTCSLSQGKPLRRPLLSAQQVCWDCPPGQFKMPPAPV